MATRFQLTAEKQPNVGEVSNLADVAHRERAAWPRVVILSLSLCWILRRAKKINPDRKAAEVSMQAYRIPTISKNEGKTWYKLTNKNQQLQDLVEHNEVLENYFRNTIIPQLFVDGELKLQKFTPPAMKQFSLSASDVGRSVHDIKDNFRFPSIVENIQQVIESNEILEKEIQTTDLRWYQMNIIPYVRIKDNKTNGVIITFVEITMRIKDLKEQEKMIADHEILLDTISHDIRNPLANMVLAIELFRDVSPNDENEFKSLLEIVEISLTKMHKLINELTEVRKDQYKYKAEEELLNFEHILEDVRLTLSDNINAAKAKITSEINVSEFTFSRRKLRTIIYNLINNAIKFKANDRQPIITVTTNKEDEFIVISIKDNGIGIDESKLDAIFSKYYRLENDIEGSGIGLNLIKEIVNNAGGHVRVKSQLGTGTEFQVYLKIAGPPADEFATDGTKSPVT